MPVCVINEKEFEIEIADTPFVKKWLKFFNNTVLPVKKPYNKIPHTRLWKTIESNKNFFQKMQLEKLTNIKETDLWSNAKLQEIHLEIVSWQKKYKKSTDFANANTDNAWDFLHDYIHDMEECIRYTTAVFGVGDAQLNHDSKTLTKNWTWQSKISADDFKDSSSFDRYHINVPFAELGRHPYESYLYSPDTYKEEGSITGQVSNDVTVQLIKTFPRPDQGYEQWCNHNAIPFIGTHFPLANFKKISEAQQLIDATEIKIIHD